MPVINSLSTATKIVLFETIFSLVQRTIPKGRLPYHTVIPIRELLYRMGETEDTSAYKRDGMVAPAL